MKKIKYSKLNIDKNIVYEEGASKLSTFREGVKDGIMFRLGEFSIEETQNKINESIKSIDKDWINNHINI